MSVMSKRICLILLSVLLILSLVACSGKSEETDGKSDISGAGNSASSDSASNTPSGGSSSKPTGSIIQDYNEPDDEFKEEAMPDDELLDFWNENFAGNEGQIIAGDGSGSNSSSSTGSTSKPAEDSSNASSATSSTNSGSNSSAGSSSTTSGTSSTTSSSTSSSTTSSEETSSGVTGSIGIVPDAIF